VTSLDQKVLSSQKFLDRRTTHHYYGSFSSYFRRWSKQNLAHLAELVRKYLLYVKATTVIRMTRSYLIQNMFSMKTKNDLTTRFPVRKQVVACEIYLNTDRRSIVTVMKMATTWKFVCLLTSWNPQILDSYCVLIIDLRVIEKVLVYIGAKMVCHLENNY